MNHSPQQSRRVVWLVRILTFVAVAMVVTTTGLVGWALNSTRRERAEVTAEQGRLDEAARSCREFAGETRADILNTLDETTLWRPLPNPAVKRFAAFVRLQVATPVSPDLRTTIVGLRNLSDRLTETTARAEAWRQRYLAIAKDLEEHVTIKRIRLIVSELRADLDTLQGRRRLDNATAYRRWRMATGADAVRLAQSLLAEQARQQSEGGADLEGHLAELARLVEVLAGEENYDSLTDLKDNKLGPTLDQLCSAVSAIHARVAGSETLKEESIEELKVALFGNGYRTDAAHQNIVAGKGGLYLLRRDALQLRKEKENLKNEISTLGRELEEVDVSFATSTRIRSATLTRQMENSLASSWFHMVLFGTVCSVLFLWLAWRITRGIGAQVHAIEQARADAEDSRQTAQQLIQDQQRAAGELALAHEGLKASELRFRTLSASAPIGIFLTDSQGDALYLNDHWLGILGRSLEECVGQGWRSSIHPDDVEEISVTWTQVATAGLEFSREFRLCTGSGEVRWVFSHAVVISSDTGERIGYVGTTQDITARKAAEAELAAMHRKLLDTSRQAGMAEVATSVLHNVGNVLNSVNVASTCVAENLRKSKASSLARIVTLLQEQEADLGAFFTRDPRARQLPAFLAQVVDRLAVERASALEELAHLQKNIDHIKQVVTMQQGYAKVSGFTETVHIDELVEDTLRMNAESLEKHDVQVIREFSEVPPVTVEKHKVLQILVNLVRNAKYACNASDKANKTITVRVSSDGTNVRVSICDNGVGIPTENLNRIFNHGFTTKTDGHGFGLHSGALSAKEMGGSLKVESLGNGHGATFILEIPAVPTR